MDFKNASESFSQATSEDSSKWQWWLAGAARRLFDVALPFLFLNEMSQQYWKDLFQTVPNRIYQSWDYRGSHLMGLYQTLIPDFSRSGQHCSSIFTIFSFAKICLPLTENWSELQRVDGFSFASSVMSDLVSCSPGEVTHAHTHESYFCVPENKNTLSSLKQSGVSCSVWVFPTVSCWHIMLEDQCFE